MYVFETSISLSIGIEFDTFYHLMVDSLRHGHAYQFNARNEIHDNVLIEQEAWLMS